MGGTHTCFLAVSLALLAACGGKSSDDLTTMVGGNGGAGGEQPTMGTEGPPPTDSGATFDSEAVLKETGDGSGETTLPVVLDASAEHMDDSVFPDFLRASNFGFLIKDSWFIMGCPFRAGHDCIECACCPNLNAPDFEDRGTVYNETFPIGGTSGTTYLMSFQLNGIAEGKFYQGGSWAQASTDLTTPGGAEPTTQDDAIANDTFYIGGTAVVSNYDVMRIRVLDAAKKEVARYYLNAYPPASGAESHRTFLLSYAHTIEVIGGGFVEYHNQASNCHVIDNCGPGVVSETECPAPRNIPNEPNVVLPTMYGYQNTAQLPQLVTLASINSVTGGSQPWHGQITHITVTKVVAK